MRPATFFAIFCVSLVATLAIPVSNQNGIANSPASIALSDKENGVKPLQLIQVTTIMQDPLSNKIQERLGMTAGQFLTVIDNTMLQVQELINVGMMQLHQVHSRVDLNTQRRIQEIVQKALEDSLKFMQPVLRDLSIVLPNITGRITIMNVADLINALLNITFEDFLQSIRTVLSDSSAILTATINELNSIALTQTQAVADELRSISNAYLVRSRDLIRPVYTNLEEVLGPASTPSMMAFVMSGSLGFDVVTTAQHLDMALVDVESILTDFVTQINLSLGMANPNIRNKVNLILKRAIRDVEAIIDPILKVFLHFMPLSSETKKDQSLYRDLSSSLLGVSLEDFLFYIDFAIPKVREIYTAAVSEIRTEYAETNPLLVLHINLLMDITMGKVERSVQPFVATISPILGEKRWVTVEEFVEITNQRSNTRQNVFCNFSMRTGYNMQLIIHLISKILGFDVVIAAQEMSTALNELDYVYKQAAKQINGLISDLHPFIGAEVNRILNVSLTTTHNTMQPAIDVFAPFVPAPGRPDKDVVREIIAILEGLKYDKFRNYAQSAPEKMAVIAKSTMSNVHQIIEAGRMTKNGRPEQAPSPSDPLVMVDKIMNRTASATQQIARPFYEIIAPIFEP
ncbi:uncharacterized protein LOC110853959 [Folsomia candida]|uniref:Uncharacterized protein n=1 Tax=Folsomia candida TaxID=158441 RepID=A0A226DYI9_FOLCA|nr:uncharacterized protein LOC110853959 [Folsomia candida]OXA50512.1 hypothetical protein Fcan01_14805 [Folsomia candida]